MQITKDYFTVHKFGGSSLANADRFKAVKQILYGDKEIVVVSAVKGATSILQQVLDLAQDKQQYINELDQLIKIHTTLIQSLFCDKQIVMGLINAINEDFIVIKNVLATVFQIKFYTKDIQNFVLGFGEIWSAKILSQYLGLERNVAYLDASTVLYSYVDNEIVYIDWHKSSVELNSFLDGKSFSQLVVTGFIAKTLDQRRTILGRNGSDYSAAIFAKLFMAKCLYIWTDVDGVYTAHPQKVRSAFVIDSMSYKEAHELAYFGATVLHPMTIAPVESENIPLYIKNSYNPDGPGTYISSVVKKSPYLIKGLTYITDVALISIEGAGLIGVAGAAAKIFYALSSVNVSVVLISQASSEHSICFAIKNNASVLAVETLHRCLEQEIMHNLIGKIIADNNCAIIAAVGEGMVGSIGTAGKLCATLALANVNIRALAQGSSERSISVVVNDHDVSRALQALHAGFYLSNRTLSVGLIGPGAVGSALLNQMALEIENLRSHYQVNICVRAIMDSTNMLLNNDAIDLHQWQQAFKLSSMKANLDQFINHIIANDIPQVVIIDCTASVAVANNYINFARNGISIITPNKHVNGGSSLAYYQQLRTELKNKNCQYLYEATVCAGLPVINTIQDLIKTGDKIIALEGVVSGTLSYLFSELAIGRDFSDVVLEAKRLGYTEPDPREDLSGNDVGRKLVCLAREIGYAVSLEDIQVVNLIPEHLTHCSLEEFIENLPSCNKQIKDRVNLALAKNERLHYVASIKADQTFSVSIQSYPLEHPFNRLSGTDNMLVIHTKRYCGDHPMIIQGPGAGAEVTAAGVFADLLRMTAVVA